MGNATAAYIATSDHDVQMVIISLFIKWHLLTRRYRSCQAKLAYNLGHCCPNLNLYGIVFQSFTLQILFQGLNKQISNIKLDMAQKIWALFHCQRANLQQTLKNHAFQDELLKMKNR
jgi:hypothetical protein